MRRGVVAFWLGAGVAYLILVLTASSSTLDVDLIPGEAGGIVMAERVDQGPLSRVLNPGMATLGTLRLTKRGWGVLTTYTQELGVTAARLAQQAGTPIPVKVSLSIPGTIIGTNAASRDGAALVWTEIPSDAPLWVRTRTINWAVVVFSVVAIALSFWSRAG